MTDTNELIRLQQALAAAQDRVQRLERVANRRRYSAQLQSALYRIADITAADIPMTEFFLALHDIMRELMYADNFFIALFNAEAGTFNLAYFVDSLDQAFLDEMQNVPISQLSGTMTGYVLRTGKPLFADESMIQALTEAGEIGSVGSACVEWLGCPLKVGDRTVGVMVVQSYDPSRRFRPSDHKLLIYIARHIGTAVERKRNDERIAALNRELEEKVAVRTRELSDTLDALQQQIIEREHSEQVREACYEIAEQSQTADAPQAFFASVHAIINRLIDARDFFIALYDRERGELSLPYFVDRHLKNPGIISMPVETLAESPLFTAKVIRTGRTVLLNSMDIGKHSDNPLVNESNPRAWLGVPLIMNGEPSGVIVVPSYEPDAAFTEQDAALLEFVATHVATALQRRRDAESLREAHQELQSINDELEHRIAERTHALASANDELEKLLAQRKIITEKLAHDAHHDVLTGLPNRALLRERLTNTIQRNQRRNTLRYALLFLDLDRFKVINDSLGHLQGDHLLCEVANRLLQCVRGGDTVARLGGDEFCVLLDDIDKTADIDVIARRILTNVAASYLLDGQNLYVTTSMGVTTSLLGYEDADALIRDADAAMYQAKSLGKNRYCFFDQSLHQNAMHRLKLETDLRTAIEHDQIIVYYQPIYDLATGLIASFEALARWQHPTLGLVSPATFIPVAEETGLINELGLRVLQAATRQVQRWRQGGHPSLSVSVNLSGRQLTQHNFLSEVRRTLADNALPAQALKLEITESLLIQHFEMAQQFLSQLQEMQIEILLDDFGTGYSSLNYLHQFPLNTVKIDRSFLQQISTHEKSLQLLRGVRTLASNLGLKLVAEGIETAEQLQRLRELQFEFGQGFLFGKPMPADGASELLALVPHPAFSGVAPA